MLALLHFAFQHPRPLRLIETGDFENLSGVEIGIGPAAHHGDCAAEHLVDGSERSAGGCGGWMTHTPLCERKVRVSAKGFSGHNWDVSLTYMSPEASVSSFLNQSHEQLTLYIVFGPFSVPATTGFFTMMQVFSQAQGGQEGPTCGDQDVQIGRGYVQEVVDGDTSVS